LYALFVAHKRKNNSEVQKFIVVVLKKIVQKHYQSATNTVTTLLTECPSVVQTRVLFIVETQGGQ